MSLSAASCHTTISIAILQFYLDYMASNQRPMTIHFEGFTEVVTMTLYDMTISSLRWYIQEIHHTTDIHDSVTYVSVRYVCFSQSRALSAISFTDITTELNNTQTQPVQSIHTPHRDDRLTDVPVAISVATLRRAASMWSMSRLCILWAWRKDFTLNRSDERHDKKLLKSMCSASYQWIQAARIRVDDWPRRINVAWSSAQKSVNPTTYITQQCGTE